MTAVNFPRSTGGESPADPLINQTGSDFPAYKIIKLRHVTERNVNSNKPYFISCHDGCELFVSLDCDYKVDMINLEIAQALNLDIYNDVPHIVRDACGQFQDLAIGYTSFIFDHDGVDMSFTGCVVRDLGVDLIAGTPFIEENDLSISPNQNLVTFCNDTSYYYGDFFERPKSTTHHNEAPNCNAHHNEPQYECAPSDLNTFDFRDDNGYDEYQDIYDFLDGVEVEYPNVCDEYDTDVILSQHECDKYNGNDTLSCGHPVASVLPSTTSPCLSLVLNSEAILSQEHHVPTLGQIWPSRSGPSSGAPSQISSLDSGTPHRNRPSYLPDRCPDPVHSLLSESEHDTSPLNHTLAIVDSQLACSHLPDRCSDADHSLLPASVHDRSPLNRTFAIVDSRHAHGQSTMPSHGGPAHLSCTESSALLGRPPDIHGSFANVDSRHAQSQTSMPSHGGPAHLSCTGSSALLGRPPDIHGLFAKVDSRLAHSRTSMPSHGGPAHPSCTGSSALLGRPPDNNGSICPTQVYGQPTKTQESGLPPYPHDRCSSMFPVGSLLTGRPPDVARFQGAVQRIPRQTN